MLGIFWRTVKDKKISLIIYSVASVGFLEMYIALFPSLQKQSQQLSALMKSYPDSFFKAFNIDPNQLSFTEIGSYLGMEQFNFIWPVMAIAFAIGFANYSLAGEVEKGTAEILLSQPISRLKIFFSKYIVGLSFLAIFTFISVFAIIPLAKMHGANVDVSKIAFFALISFLFVWAVYGIAFLASSFFAEKGKAAFTVSGILVLMYVLNIVGGLKESLRDLRYFSFFNYFQPANVIDKGQADNLTFYVFIGVAIVASLLAALWFNRKDVAV
ncbi:MAG: ABC transporter permease subunit [bacterium]